MLIEISLKPDVPAAHGNDQSDMAICDALPLNPPYTETRSPRSTVSGTSAAALWRDSDGRVGSAGEFASVASDCSVASAEDNEGLLNPIDNVPPGVLV